MSPTGSSRFIPAGAGNTPFFSTSAIAMAVHPRRRGEHLSGQICTTCGTGSSPQARGTRPVSVCEHICRRFIPAGAGNTTIRRRTPPPRSVHPRRRGEHRRPHRLTTTAPGSSPQARGTLPIKCCGMDTLRFIPAGAGNTAEWGMNPFSVAVHPRRRGEHPRRSGVFYPDRGSSPQARGTPICGASSATRPRFIPAGAGNTFTDGGIINAIYGSSPQARGTRVDAVTVSRYTRFIPAGAGNTIWTL